MLKKSIVGVLVLSLLLGIPAFAVESRASAVPTLTFSQSTANCEVVIYSTGSYIEATLSLLYGNTLIDSWDAEGEDVVWIEENCTVTRRRTYTLVASGTIDGVRFEESVTRTCS